MPEQIQEHGTMEDYITKLIKEAEKKDFDDLNAIAFYANQTKISVLYMVLTGWNNPQSNPKK